VLSVNIALTGVNTESLVFKIVGGILFSVAGSKLAKTPEPNAKETVSYVEKCYVCLCFG